MRPHLSSLWRDFPVCLALAFCCLELGGCFPGAMRLPTRTVGAAGDKVEQQQIDLSFLQVGTTTREEVLDKLAVVNTGYSNRRLFWGRWFVSKWGYWFISAGYGDASRVWKVNNVLIWLDENGVVTDKKVITDNKALWSAITGDLQHAPVLDLSNPASVHLLRFQTGAYETITITLAKDSMEVSGLTAWGKNPLGRNREIPPVRISPLDVIGVSHGGEYNPGANTGEFPHKTPGAPTCHALYFAEETAIGKKFRFCTDAPNLATLFRYLYQTHPRGMLWE